MDDSEWVILECHRFLASTSRAKQIFMNLGSFVTDKTALVDALGAERLVKAVAKLYVSYATVVDAIVPEQNAANESGEVLTPVFPHQMAALLHSMF